MNVDSILNKKSNISDDDIDEFIRKANEVEKIVNGIKNNSINPDDTIIDKLLENENENIVIKYESKYKPAISNSTVKTVVDSEKWWADVEFLFPINDNKSLNNQISNKKPLVTDYNTWSKWVPDDPVSKQEEEQIKASEEKKANEEFEKNNPDFCKQFIDDSTNRAKAFNDKNELAKKYRIKGNEYYTKKLYNEALKEYFKAYDILPYNSLILNNISQVYIKKELMEEALEFINRTLRVDPNNIKALSRKATILVNKNDLVTSLEILNKAIEIDPNNNDIINQKLDIEYMIKEIENEKNSLLLIGNNNSNDLNKCNKFLSDLRSIDDKSIIDINHDIIKDDIVDHWNDFNNLISMNENVKFYVLSQNIHLIVINILNKLISNNMIYDSNIIFDISLSTLSLLINGNRKVMKDVMQSNILSIINTSNNINLLIKNQSLNGLKSLYTLYYHSILIVAYPKLYEYIMNEKKFIQDISYVIHSLYDILITQTNNEVIEKVINLFIVINQFIKQWITIDNYKSSIKYYEIIIESISIELNLMLILTRNITRQMSEKIELLLESSLSIVATLSQNKLIHNVFIKSFNVDNRNIIPIEILIKVATNYRNYITTIFGALTNISIDPNSQCRQAIFEFNILELIQDILCSKSYDNKSVEKSISLGLLSRLTFIQEVQAIVKSSGLCRNLCQMLGTDSHYSESTSNFATDVWLKRRVNYITHVLAELVYDEKCFHIFYDENLHKSLLNLFPRPKSDITGEVTAETVCLVPDLIQDVIILGNAARCLIKCCESEKMSSFIFNLSSNGPDQSIAKLICAMATCSDIRVRKNIAIVLAKGCKISNEIRQRITALRGMQIMLELQNKF